MKTLLKSIILSLLLIGSAHALTSSYAPPPWVISGAAYDFDYAHKRYWNGALCEGKCTNIANYGPGLGYGSNGGSNANIYYVQWKDGIFRPSGLSSASDVLRISDYGLWIEGGPGKAHNYALCSRDLTTATCATAWTAANMTATKTGVVGADGTTGSATQLTATAPGATILQTITFPGALDPNNLQTVAGGGSAYSVNDVLTTVGGTCATQPQFKVTTAPGGVIMAVSVQTAGACTVLPTNPVAVTGGTGTLATFTPFWRTGTLSCLMERVTGTGSVNLTTNGGSVLTNVSGQLSTTKYLQVRAPTVNLVNNVIGITLGTSGDVVQTDFCQMEDDDQATSPILTTTSTALRGTENIFQGTNATNYNYGYQVVNNTQAKTPFAYAFTYSGNFSTTLPHGIITTDTPFLVTGAAGGGTIRANVASQILTSAASDVTGLYLASTGTGTVNKVVVSFDGAGGKICVNGSVPTKSSTVIPATSLAGGTHNNLLNNGSNLLPTNGYISRETIWTRGLSDGECQYDSTAVNFQ